MSSSEVLTGSRTGGRTGSRTSSALGIRHSAPYVSPKRCGHGPGQPRVASDTIPLNLYYYVCRDRSVSWGHISVTLICVTCTLVMKCHPRKYLPEVEPPAHSAADTAPPTFPSSKAGNAAGMDQVSQGWKDDTDGSRELLGGTGLNALRQ